MGKKFVPVRYLTVAEGIELVTVEGRVASMEETGLYPRKAAKTALVAGIWMKYWESCGTPAVTMADEKAPGRLPVSEEIIIVKKIARLIV